MCADTQCRYDFCCCCCCCSSFAPIFRVALFFLFCLAYLFTLSFFHPLTVTMIQPIVAVCVCTLCVFIIPRSVPNSLHLFLLCLFFCHIFFLYIFFVATRYIPISLLLICIYLKPRLSHSICDHCYSGCHERYYYLVNNYISERGRLPTLDHPHKDE